MNIIMSEKKKTAAGAVSFIFITVLLSKVLGQLREMVIASLYGTSAEVSAYVAASQLPVNFFDMILGSAISSAFIPVFNRFMEKEKNARANLFASRFINAVTLVTVILSCFGVMFAPQLINIFAPQLSIEAKFVAVRLLRIMFPMVIFTAMAFSLVGILQSLGEFKIPAAMSLISNTVCILYLLLLNNKFGIYGLGAALLIGWILQFTVLVFPAKKRGFNYSLKAGIWDDGLKQVASFALPVLAASWVQPINASVNIAIASGISGDSGIAVLNYANRLYIIAASVFAVSLTNYIFPKMSRMAVAGNIADWTKTMVSGMKSVLIMVLPMAIMFLLQSREIIRIVYQRGAFGEDSVMLTSTTMFFYSLGMIWYSMQELFNKGFYSLSDTKTPMFAALGGILTNVALSFALSRVMGISGLALAASVSACVWSIFSFFRIKKKFAENAFKDFEFYKIILMCLLFGVTLWLVRGFMIKKFGEQGFFTALVNFAVPAFCGAVVYAVSAFVLNLKEVQYVKNFIAKFKR